MKGVTYRALILFLTTLLIPSVATAGNDPTTIDIGGAVLTRPAYVGAEDYQTNLLPFLGFENLYGIDLRGLALSASVIEAGTGKGPGTWSIEAGPRLGFDFGRDSDDSPTLDGLEDIDPSLLLGGYMRSTIGIFGLDVSAGQDVLDGHGGFTADFSIGTRYPGDGWYIQPLATLSWADQDYTQAIYGITSNQATASSLGTFDTDSGFHQASVSLMGGVDIDDDWSLTAVLSYREALGDYRDSPIMVAPDGSASGLFATLGISRRFTF